MAAPKEQAPIPLDYATPGPRSQQRVRWPMPLLLRVGIGCGLGMLAGLIGCCWAWIVMFPSFFRSGDMTMLLVIVLLLAGGTILGGIGGMVWGKWRVRAKKTRAND